MKNNRWLTKEQIKKMVDIFEGYFTPELRQRIGNINKKYGIQLSSNRQTNLDLFWNYAKIKISKDTNTFNEIRRHNEGDFDEYGFPTGINSLICAQEYIIPYLKNNCGEDWNFVCNTLEIQKLKYRLDEVLINTGIGIDYDKLFYITDFKKYFTQFTFENIDKKAFEPTSIIYQGIDEIIDKLSKNYGNDSQKLIQYNEAIKNYIMNRNIQALNGKILEYNLNTNLSN